MKNLKSGSRLREELSGASEEILQLVESILTFDHNKRPTVQEILKNKIFDKIR